MRKQFTFIASIFLILLSINLVYALPPPISCAFGGEVTINGAPVNGTDVKAYLQDTGELVGAGNNAPSGYAIAISNASNKYIIFKIFDADVDQSAQYCSGDPSNFTLLNLSIACYGSRNYNTTVESGAEIGICRQGIETYTLNASDGTCYWLVTLSEILPGLDSDCNGLDENCDGVDDGCPAPPAPGGGGGGGGGGGCNPKWNCTDWNECPETGIQTRTCTDSNNCNKNTNKPNETQSCTYVPPIETETSAPTGGEEITQTPTTPTPGITGQATGTAGITGAFIGTPYRAVGSSLILLAIVLGIILIISKKRKKKK